jgi:hypothetical protein
MSTTLYATDHFDETRTEQSQTGRSRQASAPAFWSATTVLALFSALCDGLAAYRQYEHLKSRGIPHDDALRHALVHEPGI